MSASVSGDNKKRKLNRSYVQLIAAVLYNCNIKGFADASIYQGNIKGLCVPGLNCYSCPGAIGACPLGSLQTGLLSSRYKVPYYILGTLLLFGLFLGRFICGWICPFGFIQELIYKIPSKKIRKNKVTGLLTYLKYVILIIFVIVIPLWKLIPGFCKYICPVGTLEGGIFFTYMDPALRQITGILFTWKVFLMVLILVICVFCYRMFCRFLCPLGAIYSFFNPIAFFGIKVDDKKCTHCDSCVKNCRMDVRHICDRECIHCGDCIKHCPVDAISFGSIKNRE
ncbi:MAG: 4Fe-4S binding protein [Lachnospiraceae bacterium]|nr:4Fe-4S binding protein [Lachnospiraceae bacterium]